MTNWLAFENITRFSQCGLDVRALNPYSREVLDLFLNGQVRVAEFLAAFPLPGGDEPTKTAKCIVDAFAPMM